MGISRDEKECVQSRKDEVEAWKRECAKAKQDWDREFEKFKKDQKDKFTRRLREDCKEFEHASYAVIESLEALEKVMEKVKEKVDAL